MCERDKNNPAILLWSLGNESGGLLGKLEAVLVSPVSRSCLPSVIPGWNVWVLQLLGLVLGVWWPMRQPTALGAHLSSNTHCLCIACRCRLWARPPGNGCLPAGARRQPTGESVSCLGRLLSLRCRCLACPLLPCPALPLHARHVTKALAIFTADPTVPHPYPCYACLPACLLYDCRFTTRGAAAAPPQPTSSAQCMLGCTKF